MQRLGNRFPERDSGRILRPYPPQRPPQVPVPGWQPSIGPAFFDAIINLGRRDQLSREITLLFSSLTAGGSAETPHER